MILTKTTSTNVEDFFVALVTLIVQKVAARQADHEARTNPGHSW